jgi:hypothetical protein
LASDLPALCEAVRPLLPNKKNAKLPTIGLPFRRIIAAILEQFRNCQTNEASPMTTVAQRGPRQSQSWRIEMKRLTIFTALSGFLLCSAPLRAAVVLDQSNPPFAIGLNDRLELQQQVTAGKSGLLAGVELYGDSTSDLVRIAVGDAFYTGPFAFSETVTLSNGGFFIDTSAANIDLSVGETFVIDVSEGTDVVRGLRGTNHPYSGGGLFSQEGGVVTGLPAFSMAFQTFVGTTATVPEPSTWTMLIAGFAGLGYAGRRAQRKGVTANA